MNISRGVALPFYLTAIVVMAFPAIELVLTLVPMSPGVISWRYGAVGLLARSIMTPMVGMALLYGTALALQHRLALRLVAAVSLFGGAVLVLLMGIFAIDLRDFRGMVKPEAMLAFDASSAMVLMKLLAVSILLFAFAFGAMRAGRGGSRRAKDDKDPSRLMAFRSHAKTAGS